MKIGFDIDGVLANFIPAYQALVVKVADGKDLFHADDVNNPPCWNWPEFRGYSNEVVGEVWRRITASPNFWLALGMCADNVNTLALCIEDLEQNHDVYFVTSRPGYRAKRQTESWLKSYLPYSDEAISPTVLLASDKGAAALALKLDAYVDDNLDNVLSVLRQSPKTRVYLLNKSYNEGEASVRVAIGRAVNISPADGGLPVAVPRYDFEERTATRINTLGEMLTRELVAQ